MPELDRYLFDAQQRKEIQDRARWAALEGRQDASAPGASCGPVINPLTGERRIMVPRTLPNRGWVYWEECYAIPGTDRYLRLAWESHPIPPGTCRDQPPENTNVAHFNITLGIQGGWPNNFNFNTSGRTIIYDEHIAIWTRARTGQACVSWYWMYYGLDGRQKGIPGCVFSSCGKPPNPLFLPWTVQEAYKYFRAELDRYARGLPWLGVDPRIVEGVIFVIGCVILVAVMY